MTTTTRPPLKILLAAPRGFCAGVDRAIQIVELALRKYGPPVYVRHEIVHNRFVVDSNCEPRAPFSWRSWTRFPKRPAGDLLGAWGAKSVPADAS
jgi:4-hydroxy-3-methylbut-2-en-1-yl diphosphate reductase